MFRPEPFSLIFEIYQPPSELIEFIDLKNVLNSFKFNSRKVDLGKFQSTVTVIGVIASWSLSFNGKIIHCSSEVKLRITIGNHLKFGNHMEYFSKRVSFKIGIWQLKTQGLLLMHSLITSLIVLFSCRCLLLKQ